MTELEGKGRRSSGGWRPRWRWNRERRWVTGVALFVAAYALLAVSNSMYNATLNPDGTAPAASLKWALLSVAGLLVLGLSVLVVLSGLWWRWRTWPRRTRATALQTAHAQRARDDARLLYEVLRSGVQLTPLHPGVAVLNRGETAHLSVALQYSRLYSAGNGGYSHVTAFGTGSIGIGLMAGSMIGNSRRRAAAAADAQRCWREHQVVQATMTDQRIICPTREGHLSFYWSAVTAFFPDAGDGVVLEFEGTSPLRLAGRGSELVAVYATWRLRPFSEFEASPRLAQLR